MCMEHHYALLLLKKIQLFKIIYWSTCMQTYHIIQISCIQYMAISQCYMDNFGYGKILKKCVFLCSSHKYQTEWQTYSGRNTNAFNAKQIYSKTCQLSFDVGIFSSLINDDAWSEYECPGPINQRKILYIFIRLYTEFQ